MTHRWCTAIITKDEQEALKRAASRINLTLLLMTSVVNHLPEYLDKKIPGA
jgi:hypothetical protein